MENIEKMCFRNNSFVIIKFVYYKIKYLNPSSFGELKDMVQLVKTGLFLSSKLTEFFILRYNFKSLTSDPKAPRMNQKVREC